MDSTFLFILLAGTLMVWFFQRRIPKGLRLPPGPSPKPLIGNALDLPTSKEWETYSKWAKQYGEIVFIEVLGNRLIFLNSKRLIYELFEKRSSNYSSRPNPTMVCELVNFGWVMSLLPYGDTWRRSRRVMHEQFHATAVEKYKPIQLKHTRALLYRILINPEKYAENLRHCAGGIIMEMVYGIVVKEKDDPYIQLAEEALAAASAAGKLGAFWVDFLPVLKWVPEWFPGAEFKRKAKRWRIPCTDIANVPFEVVKKEMASGTAQSSFVTHSLELATRKDVSHNEEDIIRFTAGTIYGAGADTTVDTLIIFMLAMLLNPEAQKKAQKELDNVTQGHRLVEYSDRAYLPYTVAVVKEVLRWLPLTPIAFPHMTMKDDEIDGYYIPAGSLVIGNTWHLLRDETEYGADTDKFIPERFLQPGVKDPIFAFGYGRRICSGRYMADNSLFIAISSMLQVFDILPPTDSSGKEKPVEYKLTSGVFAYPENLQCRIRPRSADAEKLIVEWHNSL